MCVGFNCVHSDDVTVGWHTPEHSTAHRINNSMTSERVLKRLIIHTTILYMSCVWIWVLRISMHLLCLCVFLVIVCVEMLFPYTNKVHVARVGWLVSLFHQAKGGRNIIGGRVKFGLLDFCHGWMVAGSYGSGFGLHSLSSRYVCRRTGWSRCHGAFTHIRCCCCCFICILGARVNLINIAVYGFKEMRWNALHLIDVSRACLKRG